MKQRLIALAAGVRQTLIPLFATPRRSVHDDRGGGDPHFEVDEVAERAVASILATWDIPVAYSSEDRGLVPLARDPEHILIIDPIDGTRPAMVGFESCCFSVAVVPASPVPRLADVTHALVSELSSGHHFYADVFTPGIECTFLGKPRLSEVTDLGRIFWSIELTAHPVRRLVEVYGHLIDGSVTGGAVFVFTSASYSITRLITGQLDCHVDIGHRLLRDDPGLLAEFLHVGKGKVACLFPYDVAGAVFIARRAGATITDAYGSSLDELPLLTDKSPESQFSLVAAGNADLHRKVLARLKWPSRPEEGGR